MNSISLEKGRLYEKYRLPYAREAADDLLARTGQVEGIADIGAGTGQLARLFAGRSERIYAVEPDESMCRVARDVLHQYPEIAVVNAFAEETTLETDSVDLIAIGNAFHRFRPEACGELRRILRRSGWVALFSYSFANRDYTEMLFSKLAELKESVGRTKRRWHMTPVEELFGNGETQNLSYPQSISEDWEAFWGAAQAGIEAPERGDREFARFEAINREVFEAFAVDGRMRIDYETTVQFGQPKV